jgi:hypothetical protein
MYFQLNAKEIRVLLANGTISASALGWIYRISILNIIFLGTGIKFRKNLSYGM